MYKTALKLKISAYILFFSLIFVIILHIFSFNNPAYISTDANFISDTLNLIIDAGHGGEDGGAVSVTGACESVINLEIAKKVENIMALLGTPAIMTRSSDEIDYPDTADTIREKKVSDQKARLEMINSTENAVLISIHQNKFETAQPFGTQVLFAPTDGSQELAETFQNNFRTWLDPDNYRTCAKISPEIFLINSINCPGILIECGFLSNYKENQLLQTNEYQLKIATIISAGYMQSIETLSQIYLGGTNEI